MAEGRNCIFGPALGTRPDCVIYNRRLGLGSYVKYRTAHLPNLMEWKNMKSHDYVLALEPCNTLRIEPG